MCLSGNLNHCYFTLVMTNSKMFMFFVHVKVLVNARLTDKSLCLSRENVNDDF